MGTTVDSEGHENPFGHGRQLVALLLLWYEPGSQLEHSSLLSPAA
jgi:hypothetical protein